MRIKLTKNMLYNINKRIFMPCTTDVSKYPSFDNTDCYAVADGDKNSIICVKKLSAIMASKDLTIIDGLKELMKENEILKVTNYQVTLTIKIDTDYKPIDIVILFSYVCYDPKTDDLTFGIDSINATSTVVDKCNGNSLINQAFLFKPSDNRLILKSAIVLGCLFKARDLDPATNLWLARKELVSEYVLYKFLESTGIIPEEPNYIFIKLKVFNPNGDAIDQGARNIQIIDQSIGFKNNNIMKDIKDNNVAIINKVETVSEATGATYKIFTCIDVTVVPLTVVTSPTPIPDPLEPLERVLIGHFNEVNRLLKIEATVINDLTIKDYELKPDILKVGRPGLLILNLEDIVDGLLDYKLTIIGLDDTISVVYTETEEVTIPTNSGCACG